MPVGGGGAWIAYVVHRHCCISCILVHVRCVPHITPHVIWFLCRDWYFAQGIDPCAHPFFHPCREALKSAHKHLGVAQVTLHVMTQMAAVDLAKGNAAVAQEYAKTAVLMADPKDILGQLGAMQVTVYDWVICWGMGGGGAMQATALWASHSKLPLAANDG